MLAVTRISTQNTVDIYQCPEGKSAVVYIDLWFDNINVKVEIAIAVWNNDFQDYDNFTYWRGGGNFISLGPIWLNSRDKIQGCLFTVEGDVNCFVHGIEY